MGRCWIALFVVASLLAACARSVPDDTEVPVTEVELVIGLNHQPLRLPLGEVIRSFEAKHPGVTVRVKEWERPIFDGSRPVTEELIQQEMEGVDILLAPYSISAGQPLYEHGYLRDLSAFNLPDPDPLIAEYMHDLGIIDGQRVYIPLVRLPLLLIVHEGVFEQLGMALPQADWRYTEFEAILLELKAEGLLWRTRLSKWFLMDAVVTAHGGKYYNFTEGRWEVDTPENRSALGFLSRLAENGLLEESTASINFDAEHDQSAVMVSTTRQSRGYWAVPFPAGPVRQTTPAVEAVDAMILSTTNSPELATAFLAELLSPDVGFMAMSSEGIRPLFDAPEAIAVWRDQVGSDWAASFDAGLAGLLPEKEREIPRSEFPFIAELLEAVESGRFTPELLANLDLRLHQ